MTRIFAIIAFVIFMILAVLAMSSADCLASEGKEIPATPKRLEKSFVIKPVFWKIPEKSSRKPIVV